jgi:hypothetical protein
MKLKTDYLIIGSGAVGMAFADTILSETEANIIIVDRYAKPGGHWNVAYPFVTLHQPSAFYGVNSMELSSGEKDKTGLNIGLGDLASGASVSAYFDEVMRHKFLPTGRVKYYPMCDYQGAGKFVSIMTGEAFEVTEYKKIVDATYLKTSVPSTHTPNFSVAEEVQFMPINDLVHIKKSVEGFVIIGGGKTGIDAMLWLLKNRVNPDHITWIISRDAWLIDRENTQPTEDFFYKTIGAQANQLEAVAKSKSIPDLFEKLETAGVLLRLDKNFTPKMFHGATVSKMELAALQRVKNVVRLGRVQSIDKELITLKEGSIPTSVNHVHVDCSATPIRYDIESIPVFNGKVITPQTVRSYQPVFSAAFIAHIEANYEKEVEKNQICGVVPLPNHDTDWIKMQFGLMMNQFNWGGYKEIGEWLLKSRLDGFTALVKNAPKEDEMKQALLKKMRGYAPPAMMKLHQYIKEIEKADKQEFESPQFQINKKVYFVDRIKETPKADLAIGEGEILLKIDQFAFSANNITYAVVGDQIGYWKFFPPVGENSEGWGVLPVWGFADVVESNVDEIPVGDRLFGYFSPSKHLKMKPVGISDKRFIDGSAHRKQLPAGYNMYRRVHAEPNYNKAFDRERSLLFPLHLTSFCIWDALQDNDWYGAQQILVLSASSKTSIGLGYAFDDDENAPNTIGVTSSRNLEMVKNLDIYDQSIAYEMVSQIDPTIPTVIVDMSGNQSLLVALHTMLGDNMKKTVNVGLTHWTNARPKKGIITERSEFFFAPGHIQKRLKDWGPAGFDQRTAKFMLETAAKSRQWLNFKEIDGLKGLAKVLPAVVTGQMSPSEGVIVTM